MNAYSNGPIHQRARFRRPLLIRASVADPRWHLGLIRSSCGHVLGIGVARGRRQASLIWAVCR